ncbi:MAG: DNA polymerase II large subunit, partial [Candidatus Thermoplasmatota archaeon]|nr:DNA polymerase II large subunit [Candidatus Thermoplasmatota archaeon]
GGVLCRIIGWTDASAGYAHPLFHAAKRRNCDGDEDCVMLLLEGLLNFSKDILPSNRGGQMDAPLVLTTRLLPNQIDKEALNVDCSWSYPLEFYQATLSQPHSSGVKQFIDIVENRVGTIGDVRGYGWTHDSAGLSSGPSNSQYKLLPSMEMKMDAQLMLASRLRAVSVKRVAKQVIESHFLRDIRGNLVAFTRQKIRCVKCNASYRRIPLTGTCIAKVAKNEATRRLGNSSDHDSRPFCGGNLTLTVSPGAVKKYIGVTNRVIEKYGIDLYTEQRVKWMEDSVESLLENDKVTIMTLGDFI